MFVCINTSERLHCFVAVSYSWLEVEGLRQRHGGIYGSLQVPNLHYLGLDSEVCSAFGVQCRIVVKSNFLQTLK